MITFINFDVGSGIEYIGNVFINWTKEISKEISIISNQNPGILIYNELMKYKPKIIVLNEYYERALEAISYYKLSFPETKIIFINHSGKTVKDSENRDRYIAIRELYKKIDIEIILNGKNERNKIHFGYMPVDYNEYKIKTEWKKRKKDFMILGNINDQKINPEFIKNNEVKMNCYGMNNGNYELFNKDDNLNYINQIKQEYVCDILNEYKFTVFPFGGKEIFSISILQSMLSGTIPLVLNDSGNNWSKWTNGLVFESDGVEEFVKNIKQLLTDNNNYSILSKNIRKNAIEKYDYFSMKSKYIDILRNF